MKHKMISETSACLVTASRALDAVTMRLSLLTEPERDAVVRRLKLRGELRAIALFMREIDLALP